MQHGAPGRDRMEAKPHVAPTCCAASSPHPQEIESLGGEVPLQRTALTGLGEKTDDLVGITATNGSFACETLVFAVGPSAQDTFHADGHGGLVLECKPFSVGFPRRAPASEIEKSLYHEAAGHRPLPGANTSFPSTSATGACIPSVCVGGRVVASASEEGRVVTSGMSYHARSGKNANAAVVVSVNRADFANDPRRAIAFNGAGGKRPTRPAVRPGLTPPRPNMYGAFWKAGAAAYRQRGPPTAV